MHHFIVASLTAAGLCVGLTAAASGADLGRPAPAPVYAKAAPAPAWSWTGLYIGANAGYGWGNSDPVTFSATTPSAVIFFTGGAVPGTVNPDAKGALAGGQIGYNWQWTTWVFGVEGDFDWANIQGTNSVSTKALGFVPFTTSAEEKITDLSTIRARAGYAVDHFLFYGTGGVAFGQTDLNTSIVGLAGGACGPAGLCAINSTSSWRAGWTAGGGVEWAFARNLSAKAEYLYYDLGTQSHNANDPASPTIIFGSSGEFRGSLVRAGINYKFW
jgi:outer membrane immunogenic protein